MSDGTTESKPYLETLGMRGIPAFRHIVLVSSPQDSYVPFYSARLELPCVRDVHTRTRGVAQSIASLVSRTVESGGRVIKFAVRFPQNSLTGLGALVGRAARMDVSHSRFLIRLGGSLAFVHGDTFS